MQMPSAALIMKLGAKKVMGLNLIGTCGAYFALPFVAALGSTTDQQARLMAGCLAVAGIFQAPLVAGQKSVQRNWLPKLGSPSRPIHHKLVSLGELFGQGILASTLTPWIASNFGWRAVNVLMGGGGLVCAALWFAFAKAEPTAWRVPGQPEDVAAEKKYVEGAVAKLDVSVKPGELQAAGRTPHQAHRRSTSEKPVAAASQTGGKKTDWRLFRQQVHTRSSPQLDINEISDKLLVVAAQRCSPRYGVRSQKGISSTRRARSGFNGRILISY